MEGYSLQTFYTQAESGKSSPIKSLGLHIPAPQVSAASWSIVNIETGECLSGKNANVIRDIASLTKIMTLFIVKQCMRHKLITDQDIVKVPHDAIILGGTTANLRYNDSIKVIDLLYGLMLPSGNDAAYTLAEYCGEHMLKDVRINKKKTSLHPVDFFVRQMNVWAKHLKLKNTTFLNPHGLSHLGNHSTASEISKIACLLIKRPYISKIVNSTNHSCTVENSGIPRKLNWANTNLLLKTAGVTGFKTGRTHTAGPCLCATFNNNNISLCITLLNSRTAEKRWTEAIKLYEWVSSQLEYIFMHSEKNIYCRKLAGLVSSL